MACVLVVDDDDDIRDTVRFLLEDEGHEVLEAADGQTALDMIRTHTEPMIVLLDLLMPYVNGIDVLREVSAHADLKTRHAYVLVTADNTSLRQQAAPWVSQVSAEMLSKPFDLDHLLAVIDHAGRSQQQRPS